MDRPWICMTCLPVRTDPVYISGVHLDVHYWCTNCGGPMISASLPLGVVMRGD